jgi:hypothetical protein
MTLYVLILDSCAEHRKVKQSDLGSGGIATSSALNYIALLILFRFKRSSECRFSKVDWLGVLLSTSLRRDCFLRDRKLNY